MAREISPICNFTFDSIFTCLPTDKVDMGLTIRMVKDIYTYHKDHTVESMTFSPWSKSVIPLPSSRRKIQAYKDKSKRQGTMTWNNGMV